MNPLLIIATANPHKVREIGQILHEMLPEVPVELRSAADFPWIESPVESGSTFAANALIKARAFAEATGRLALADDSGLVVDALDGRPGVQSARYAATTRTRIDRVLEEMAGVATSLRTARFECHMALVDGHGDHVIRQGTVHGLLTEAPRGDSGFGYDPIFELTEPEYRDRTMAELSSEEKNALSHRGRALRALAPILAASLRAGRVIHPEAGTDQNLPPSR
jgi:XTP/dITP diphosphohydrolase